MSSFIIVTDTKRLKYLDKIQVHVYCSDDCQSSYLQKYKVTSLRVSCESNHCLSFLLSDLSVPKLNVPIHLRVRGGKSLFS